MNAKLIGVEYALDSARAAMEIHAAAGLMKNLPMERYLRDAQHIYAPAGTSDIQLLRLAQVALGQSKGQWSQRLSTVLSCAPRPSSPGCAPQTPAEKTMPPPSAADEEQKLAFPLGSPE